MCARWNASTDTVNTSALHKEGRGGCLSAPSRRPLVLGALHASPLRFTGDLCKAYFRFSIAHKRHFGGTARGVIRMTNLLAYTTFKRAMPFETHCAESVSPDKNWRLHFADPPKVTRLRVSALLGRNRNLLRDARGSQASFDEACWA